MNKIKCLLLLCALLTLSSCGSTGLVTHSVAFQSVRTRHAQPTKSSPIPDGAKISVAYTISSEGKLTAVVFNRTDEIMTIDQTKSFFVNSNGVSTSYYDPTVRTTSTTELSSRTKGGSVNLGAIAGAFGIGGIVGRIADGVNLGGSGTTGTSLTEATYIADMPQVSLAPHGKGAMSKVFKVDGIGKAALSSSSEMRNISMDENQSNCRFSVCISYSFDNGATYEKLVTNFYVNSFIVMPVKSHGQVNDALLDVYHAKPDALNEYCWQLHANTNHYLWGDYNIIGGGLYDYQ